MSDDVELDTKAVICEKCGEKFDEIKKLENHKKQKHNSKDKTSKLRQLSKEEKLKLGKNVEVDYTLFEDKYKKRKLEKQAKTQQGFIEISAEEVEEFKETKGTKEKGLSQKIKGLFSRSKKEREKYSPEKHGPLVDLELPEETDYEEVEKYAVNEPYAFVRITYNPETHTYKYRVLEPELTDAEQEIFEELKEKMTETLEVDLNKIEEDPEKHLREKTTQLLEEFGIRLNPKQREKILYYLVRDFHGYERIDPLIKDPKIEDISCDGPEIPIYIYHQKYESIESNVKFENENTLDSFVIKLAQRSGRHISIADPLLDATLPDGSRIQISLSKEVTTKGSTFTIRKYREDPFTPPDLVDFGTFSSQMIAYFWLAVENGKSAIFAGGTASGKTTSLNAISLFIPPEMKIVTIEDTRELNLPHPNWIPGVTRQSFGGGEGTEIGMYQLLKSALRQRPEYVVVGEVRGEEAYVLFQAMSTGHTTFSTMHADSIETVVHRLENPPLNVPRAMMEALDIASIQILTRAGGERVRRCRNIVEVVGLDPYSEELITNNVFSWIPSRDEFRYSGTSHLFEEIMEEKGMSEDEIKEELERRQEIVEWMRMKDVRHYEDVAKIVVGYYREPKKTMKIVKDELYED
ncbi:secretion system protein E [archaeon SCG-AAA382B04]|nr:secretion system protein E [archaeon SCG-AAA382B04]